MYAVVGCSDCEALWVVSGRPETTSCPRCGARRRFAKLKKFAETEDADAAKNVRSAMVQRRAGYDGDLDDFATMGERAMDSGMDDGEFLTASGLDADEVADAGERADGHASSGSLSKREAVERAVADLDRPTESEIAEYAADHGVERDYVERALDKLARAGAVTESGGRYRPL
ncbi:DUF5817 domain-containing protein [Halosegnis marinus]|uniref:DUF5817 domain-containing protein n=1 Tax=Halosegnis marinus TaxID=3034023 RepID=A0ABD5ZMF1_9EURY|nr:DUF5817 domain-containing protein [Halosegnis sp. DT85]